MGWSCDARASATMRALSDACVKAQGTQNGFGGTVPDPADPAHPHPRFFWEVSRVEHEDGAITGSVLALCSPDGHYRRAGGFRIEPDGRLSRAPARLRAMLPPEVRA